MFLQSLNKLETDWKPLICETLGENEGIETQIQADIDKFDGALLLLPPVDKIFSAFSHFDVSDLKVVILGQDCYPTKGDAMGLCFSVPKGVRIAPSLRNVFKELEREYGTRRIDADLTDWAQQGVLLLNTALTVRESCAGSHLKIWKPFTKRLIGEIAKKTENVVWMLWGAHAQQYATLIDHQKHLVLKGIHPSPLAATRGSFVGCGHFGFADAYLAKFDRGKIQWT